MEKVKYNKNEYAEYLRSPEWKRLRDYVVELHPMCEKCNQVASRDVHHLQYKQIVDVSFHDLIAVCHECHLDIHLLIKAGKIPQHGHSIDLKKKTLSFTKEEVEKIRQWRSQKHYLPEYLKYKLRKASNHARRKAFAVLGVDQTFQEEKINKLKISGAKLEELKRILRENKKIARQNKKTAYYRQQSKPEIHY